MYKLIKSSQANLVDISVCHKLCFNQSLSVRLGMPYIKKSFEWFLTKENCFLFHVVSSDGLVVGYCGGFIPRYIGDGSTSGIMQYAMRQALAGIMLRPWLLLHPEVMAVYPLIFKNIIKKTFPKKEKQKVHIPVASFDKRAGLVVIGVHPQYRGTGVFATLMAEFEKSALDRGLTKLVLSVKKTNTRAVNAYTKQGWFVSLEHPATLEMTKNLQ